MPKVSNGALRERVDFSRIKTSIPIPNLIEVQKRSYERFLQMDLLPKEREDAGLQIPVTLQVVGEVEMQGCREMEEIDGEKRAAGEVAVGSCCCR